MFYINTVKRCFVNSVNMPLKTRPVFDFKTVTACPFTLLNKCGKLLDYTGPAYIAANTVPGESIGCIFYATAQVTAGTGSFNIDTYTENYLQKIKRDGTEILLEVGLVAPGGDVIALRDTATAMPRIYVSGRPPARLDDYYTRTEADDRFARKSDADALKGRVDDAEDAIDALGQTVSQKADRTVATPEADGLMSAEDKVRLDGLRDIIADPVADIPVYDSDWGFCRYLDGTFTRIGFIGRVNGLRRVRLEVVSANPLLSGNIVIIPVFSGVDQLPVIIPVGGNPSRVAFDCVMESGTLTLRRDIDNPADTLRDGFPVTAVILDAAFEVSTKWE